MDTSRKKQFATAVPSGGTNVSDAERRHIGRIVHDDRGNASVDWQDAPSNYKRQVFEIEEQPGVLTIEKAPRTFNPYETATLPEPKKSAGPKKDLKKLSEWIKMMRDLEEKKRRGELG
ncbi:MAG TPA: hypothetical protein VI653_23545 [Steroidobacteraceae bacterium]